MLHAANINARLNRPCVFDHGMLYRESLISLFPTSNLQLFEDGNS